MWLWVCQSAGDDHLKARQRQLWFDAISMLSIICLATVCGGAPSQRRSHAGLTGTKRDARAARDPTELRVRRRGVLPAFKFRAPVPFS
jgi:hypothetical protein